MNPFIDPDELKTYMEKWRQPFLENFPFGGDAIHKQVMETLQYFLPGFLTGQTAQRQARSRPEPQVFETHDFVIVRIPLAQDDDGKPRLSVDAYHLYVSRLSGQKDALTIQLPSPVKPKSAKAEFRNGILEVRLVKHGYDPTAEINIDEKR